MERLTERDEYGNADIIGVDSVDLQSNLAFEEFNKVTEALNRLAHYEDLEMTPEEIHQTLENFSAFLCEVTGNRMSKTNYTVKAMVSEVYDYFERACDDCYEKKEYTRYKDLEEQGRLKEVPTTPIKFEIKEKTRDGINTRQKFACPRCSTVLFIQNHIDFSRGDGFERFPQGSRAKHCHNCGQHLEWSVCAETEAAIAHASDVLEGGGV